MEPPVVAHPSILLSHGERRPRAYVLFHGLTASPRQFATVGRALFEDGANVVIPRLPRHGYGDRLTPTLRDLSANELAEFALAEVAAARALGDEVVVAGFSLGGLLSAVVGQRTTVAHAVAIAPFLGFAWLPQRLMPLAWRAARRAPNTFFWWDPVRRERLGPAHGYPRYATHALAAALALGEELASEANRAAPKTERLSLVVNAGETSVHNGAVRTLARRWRRHDARVDVRAMRGLRPSHDILEFERSPRLAARALPFLLDVVRR